MLAVEPFGFEDCNNIWAISSVKRLHELYLRVLKEARKSNSSVWNIEGIPKSYLQNGYCSAALKSYQEYHVENNHEHRLLDIFESFYGDENDLPSILDFELSNKEVLIEGLDELQGQEVIRAVRVRSNQNIFRKMILKIYNQSCCITGLNIPEINRASHIIPWAEDDTIRLDPRNGICLSATYDAAFDRNLISLDDDYRIILSKDIKDYYTTESVKTCFMDIEGMMIYLPFSYLPSKANLESHRNNGDF